MKKTIVPNYVTLLVLCSSVAMLTGCVVRRVGEPAPVVYEQPGPRQVIYEPAPQPVVVERTVVVPQRTVVVEQRRVIERRPVIVERRHEEHHDDHRHF